MSVNAHFSSKLTLANVPSRIPSANILHLIPGQTGATVPFPLCLPIFVNHIISIVLGSAKKQVIWVAASTIITLMAHLHIVRQITIGKQPSDSVSEKRFAFMFMRSIVVFITTGFPFPALIEIRGFIDFRPKAGNLFRGIIRSRHVVDSYVSHAPAVDCSAGSFRSFNYSTNLI